MYAQATTLIRKFGMEKEKKNRRNYEMERKTEPQPAAVGSWLENNKNTIRVNKRPLREEKTTNN